MNQHDKTLVVHGHLKTCYFCGDAIEKKGNKKYCSYQENPACWESRRLESLSAKAYLEHVGETKQSFIDKYGLELYGLIVTRIPNVNNLQTNTKQKNIY